MAERKNYLKYYELDVSIDEQATQDILDLLDETVLGTPGGIRYRLRNIPERLKDIPEIYFLSLRKFNHILGTIGFVKRSFYFHSQKYTAFYLRYFSIKSPIPTTGRTRIYKKRNTPGKKKKNILKERIEAFMIHSDKYLNPDENEKTVLFAYIEQENIRSMEMSSKVGYKTVRVLSNEFFSRVFPKADPRVGKIKEEEKDPFRKRLAAFYKDFSFYTEDFLFYHDHYFVYRMDNEIIASVQAIPVEWQITEMPGVSGRIFQSLMPYVPYLRRLFNPRRFKFVSLDAIYYREGYEQLLVPLFESVLALQGVHTAITWHDRESPVLKTIRNLPRLGIFRKLTSAKPVDIRMRFLGLSDSEKENFYQHPAYMVAFDAT